MKRKWVYLCSAVMASACMGISLNAQEHYGFTEYTVERLGEHINTYNFDEIAPVISKNGKELYFTRVDDDANSRVYFKNGYEVTSNMSKAQYGAFIKGEYSKLSGEFVSNPFRTGFNQDVWMAISYSKFGGHERLVHPGYPLNNALPNSICTRTPNPNEFIVINQFDKMGGIKRGFSKVTKLSEQMWSFPEPVNIVNYATSTQEVNLNMSADGQNLIIAMTSPYDSYGGMDLYVSHKTGENQWSAPMNLGASINTSGKETTPFLSRDGRTLYFASDRPGSLGGTDIYYCTRQGEGWRNWSKPKRMKPPINTRADDSQPSFCYLTGYLYFTSRRMGTGDIYRAMVASSKALISGKVLDSETNQPIDAKIIAVDLETGQQYVYPAVDGHFQFEAKPGFSYELKPEKKGYIGQYLSAKVNDYGDETELNIKLDPLKPNAKISLNTIYFKRSYADILEKSFHDLRNLAKTLKSYPNIQVRIEGHTDSNGKKEALEKLSKERAEAVKAFLVKEGIQAERITTKGFGAAKPVAKNDSESERKKNRRVEVRITKT